MFVPKTIIFEKNALDYDMGKRIFETFKNKEVRFIRLSNNRIKEHIKGNTPSELYKAGKETLVVGVKKVTAFQSCKPSANYQLPLISGCTGQCEYCYLNTQLGDKPYIKVNVNEEDILQKASDYINNSTSGITIFEGAATSDPVPVEPYTHSLKRAIEFFGEQEHGRFRFVTKFTDIDTLLDIKHNGHTEIRFSLNTDTIIKKYEHKTASADKRIEALVKADKAGYRTGVLIAPVFIYAGWEEEYTALLKKLEQSIGQDKNKISFEIISHRYTTVAKNRIYEYFPDTELPMEDEKRKFKYGQFGYGKFVYQKDSMDSIKSFFTDKISDIFSKNQILYII